MSSSDLSFYDSSGSGIAVGAKLAEGGEAEIYSVSNDSAMVAKIYKASRPERGIKLSAMLKSPPLDPTLAQGHRSICWPRELVQTRAGQVVGFLMNRVDFRTNRPTLVFYNPQSRRRITPGFTWQYLVSTAMNICSVAEAIHSQGHVIGDVNESNFLVSTTSLVTLVDCDSMQVRDPKTGRLFRCPVGKGEFTPPEGQNTEFSRTDRDTNADCFGLGVLFFLLLMEGFHPFAGRWQGDQESPTVADNICNGRFPFANARELARSPAAPAFEILPVAIRELFGRCFIDGHASPDRRPRPNEWRQAFANLGGNLETCPRNEHHRFGNHLDRCPWCERTLVLGGLDPFPIKASAYHPPVSKPVFMPSPVPSVSSPQRPSRRLLFLGGVALASLLVAAGGLKWLLPSPESPLESPLVETAQPSPIQTESIKVSKPARTADKRVVSGSDRILQFVVALDEFDASGNPVRTATVFSQEQIRKKGLIVYLPYIEVTRPQTLRVTWSAGAESASSPVSDVTPGPATSIVAHLGKQLSTGKYSISLLLNEKVLQRSEITVEPDRPDEKAAVPAGSQVDIPPAPVRAGADGPKSNSYSAVHKHLIGGCNGTLLLTEDEIGFSSAEHSFHLLRREVELDGDGVKDKTGKNWHFRIPNIDVKPLFAQWHDGKLPQ